MIPNQEEVENAKEDNKLNKVEKFNISEILDFFIEIWISGRPQSGLRYILSLTTDSSTTITSI